ncbi:LemA protein [Hydrogenoanaerobacterium saccharovorans]|uniref:LemA protein n=2 Tax=Hydrogenoanaerobacterium saccharovorans TaxID=474960 RepID=A0A1H8AQR0_9FIRM|nr:LemA protein [Hydrogenoanaerobacterium saccharovorans]SEM73071.1 LemA protein [Hydrogenoanaerobacterium saccharovorans]
MKKMSGGIIALIVVVLVVAIAAAWGVGNYNSLVGLREDVTGQSSNIDTQLQRRTDLIPNLVATVKGYAAHETEIMTALADARANLAGAGTMQEKANADAQLSGALSRLLVVVENYPNLKADAQYTALMDELAGTENRIAVSRKDYNDTARVYNKRIKSFPSVIFANMFGFDAAEYFEATEGSDVPPTVDFSK